MQFELHNTSCKRRRGASCPVWTSALVNMGSDQKSTCFTPLQRAVRTRPYISMKDKNARGLDDAPESLPTAHRLLFEGSKSKHPVCWLHLEWEGILTQRCQAAITETLPRWQPQLARLTAAIKGAPIISRVCKVMADSQRASSQPESWLDLVVVSQNTLKREHLICWEPHSALALSALA